MFTIIKLNEKDNIGIATMDIPQNVDTNLEIKSKDKIPYGHKISLKKIFFEAFLWFYTIPVVLLHNQPLPGL